MVSLRLLGGDSLVQIIQVIDWYKKYQLLHGSFKMADVLDSASLSSKAASSIAINFFMQAICHMFQGKIVVADDHNVSLLEVTSRTPPLLVQLKGMRELSF